MLRQYLGCVGCPEGGMVGAMAGNQGKDAECMGAIAQTVQMSSAIGVPMTVEGCIMDSKIGFTVGGIWGRSWAKGAEEKEQEQSQRGWQHQS